MNTITIQDIKRNGSKALSNDEVTYLIVNSNVDHVIVPHEWYKVLVEALDELEDIQAIEEFEDSDKETLNLNEAVKFVESDRD